MKKTLEALALMTLTTTAAGQEADLVLRGGRVWAGKGLGPASAIAVRGERVLAVGSDAAIAPLVTPRTRVVELRGRLVVPGFNDAHVLGVNVDLAVAGGRVVFERRAVP